MSPHNGHPRSPKPLRYSVPIPMRAWVRARGYGVRCKRLTEEALRAESDLFNRFTAQMAGRQAGVRSGL